MKQLFLTKIQWAARVILPLFLLTLLIFLPDVVYFLKNGVYNYLLIGMLVVPMLFLIPTVLFSFNLNIYYYILAIIAALTPIALLPVLLINSQPNSEMLGLMLDTNYHEVIELLGWRLILIVLLMVLFFIVFLKITRKLPKKISWKKGILVSLIALSCFLVLPFLRTTALRFYTQILKNTYKAYYPFRIEDAVDYLSRELKNVDNYNKTVANFKFEVFNKKPTDAIPKIQILLIGETGRYDHWSINGYSRNTSPFMSAEQNVITFSDAASGGTMTNISVPLIITRADASSFELHKHERSILTAYKEAGYKSYWISNQSKYGLTGNIGMHYKDGDTAIFNGWGSNETNFQGNTDSALVPIIKNVLEKEKGKNIFLAVHMIGSHWRYLLRYPEAFTKFTPVSDRNRMVMGYPGRDIMINEYDNSILYADYIIHEIIELVKSYQAETSLAYVADHGENLGDDARKLYFHSYNPSYYTAKVPFFIWTSDLYNKNNQEKVMCLRKNKDRPVSSASNLFYTLLDMSNIGFKKEDSTKSISSPFFINNDQKVLGENKVILSFKDIK